MKLSAEKFITEIELKKLLSTIKSMSKNHYFLFFTLAHTGLRISEALALNWEDIMEDYILVRNGKGGKSRNIIIGKKLRKILDSYKENEGPLFTVRRKRMKRDYSYKLLKKYLKAADIRESISAHSFRHYFATYLIDNHISLGGVRDMLGHSSISVTSVYLGFSKQNQERIKNLL